MLSKRFSKYCNNASLYKLCTASVHTKFAIVGGGTAGMNVCSQLLSEKIASPSEITVFDPSPIHYYQPGFTMVAGGVLGSDNHLIRRKLGGLIQKPIEQVFNSKINLIHDSIGEYIADENKLYTLSNNEMYSYDILIMCTGIELRYDLIDGLLDALNDDTNPCGSMYHLNYALKMNEKRSQFNGGKVIATQAPMPIKCGGAPQKWIYLTEYEFRKMGIKSSIESFKFFTHLNCMFGVKKYDVELRKFVAQKNIEPIYQTELVKVDGDKRKCYFKYNANDGKVECESYDLLHVVPPQRPNRITASSSFVDINGFVDVNMNTLQNKKYENIFGVGDCTNAPCPKTAAAVFAMTPTVINNISLYLKKEKLLSSFDGYASCPIFIGDNKLLLAEFIYNNIPKETFNKIGIDQSKPKRAFYHLKKDFFPYVYWNHAPRGMWYGVTTWKKPQLKEL